MYQKLEEKNSSLDLKTTLYSTDTMSYIGRGLLEKGDHCTALQWFRRAYYTATKPSFSNSTENRVAIHHALSDFIKAILQEESGEHLGEASNIIDSTEKRWGICPITMHWRIQILRKSQLECVDNNSIKELIKRTIGSFDFTTQSFNLLLHYITELGVDDLALAISLLDKLQTSVVIPNRSPKSQEWLNMCILRHVWLLTADTKQNGLHFVSDLSRTLAALHGIISEPLEAQTASAIRSVCKIK
jgi:hypothetical protein